MGDVRISARSTLGALNKWIETISGNLVGSTITGYKATRVNFADSLVDLVRGGSGRAGGLGGLNPVQVSNGGISVGSTTTDFRQGSLSQTGNNTDLAIQGNAFFTLADSSGKIVYTRDGGFNFDDQGFLVTKEGQTVLGVYDATRNVVGVQAGAPSFSDIASGAGILVTGGAALFGAGGALSGFAQSATNVNRYFENPNTPGQDRVILNSYISAGALNGTANANTTQTMVAYTIGGTAISVSLTATENTSTRTSADNARLIARSVNAQSNITGIGCSVVVNQNDQNLATLVFSSANRAVSEASTRLSTNAAATGLATAIQSADVGLTKIYRDNKNNTFYAVNALLLSTAAPAYQPAPGDVMSFDSTGSLVNNSRGKDAISAPPVNTGVHVALSKFTNEQGLQKRRGSSQFQYTEASGAIVIGYAGQSKQSQINTQQGLEVGGVSSLGTENTIISQAVEASNSSVTDALPELTVAQKTFTSNTKVVNVGNTIVDDLNGLIR